MISANFQQGMELVSCLRWTQWLKITGSFMQQQLCGILFSVTELI